MSAFDEDTDVIEPTQRLRRVVPGMLGPGRHHDDGRMRTKLEMVGRRVTQYDISKSVRSVLMIAGKNSETNQTQVEISTGLTERAAESLAGYPLRGL